VTAISLPLLGCTDEFPPVGPVIADLDSVYLEQLTSLYQLHHQDRRAAKLQGFPSPALDWQ
jgi:hypothetical protein